MPALAVGLDRAQIAPTRAAVGGGVGVEDLGPGTGAGKSHSVVAAVGTGEIEQARHHRAVGTPSQEADDVVRGVVRVDPLVALGLGVLREQGGTLAVDAIEIGGQRRDPLVQFAFPAL